MGHLANAEGLVVDDHRRFWRCGTEGSVAVRTAGLPLNHGHFIHRRACLAGVLR